ncbi:exonuclease SbcCD subunit D [Endozoicomonas atrinae]|uniref:exonuclease SbcCD subunit D n=1 Tax=Endozoicomonas atrinae TaxID=1333660 RepID=UPI000824723E|nr:exonuclease SbcCD subunit D [Endozoicomonas atrinae]
MRILHTSDWHIGRQLHGQPLLEDQEHVLQQLVDYIVSENIDVVVIAGDVYDRAVPPAAAVSLLDDTLNRICNELNVQVIMVSGNHDSAKRLGFASRQLSHAGLHIISHLGQITEPVVITVGDETVRFYGIPYCDPENVRDQFDTDVRNYDEAHCFLIEQIADSQTGEAPSVLISHCFVDGCEDSESERPLSVGGADRVSWEPMKRFDYVALGHLHSPQHKGEKHIRYSGSILKYSFSEQNQKKGATLVELDKCGLGGITHLPLKAKRDVRVIEGELKEIMEQGRVDPGADDYVLVRLTDTHAILDPMGKVREVYPNTLHLERANQFVSDLQTMNREQLKRNELEMFCDFYKEITGQDLSDAQHEAITKEIDSLNSVEESDV